MTDALKSCLRWSVAIAVLAMLAYAIVNEWGCIEHARPVIDDTRK